MSDVELQTLLGFDQDDLAANRMGKLSPKQEKRIRNAQRLHSLIFTGAGSLSILIAISIGINVLSTSTASQNEFGNLAARIGLPAIALGFLAWGSFKISAQKIDQSVQCARGRVRFVRVEKIVSEKKSNGSTLYRNVEDDQLRVGNIVFETIDRKIFSILEEKDIYIFYYTKDTKDILSAEWMAKGK